MIATIMLLWSTLGAFWAYIRHHPPPPPPPPTPQQTVAKATTMASSTSGAAAATSESSLPPPTSPSAATVFETNQVTSNRVCECPGDTLDTRVTTTTTTTTTLAETAALSFATSSASSSLRSATPSASSPTHRTSTDLVNRIINSISGPLAQVLHRSTPSPVQSSELPSTSRLPYQVLDLTNDTSQPVHPHHAHHHHCCLQYHPYVDTSLTEPSCPFWIYRESPSSVSTISSSVRTTGATSGYTPSPYQSSGDLDFTSDCLSECGLECQPRRTVIARPTPASSASASTSRLRDFVPQSASVERIRCGVYRKTSSGSATPAQYQPHFHYYQTGSGGGGGGCSGQTPNRNGSNTYHYKHRHSSSTVIMNNATMVNYSNRKHRSSYPSYGIRHSISGTLRIGPRIYRGRSSQRYIYMVLTEFV